MMMMIMINDDNNDDDVQVLDRLCLVTYTTFTIVATVTMLSTAPHVFV